MSAAELSAAFRPRVDVGQPVDCPHCKAVGYAGVPTIDGRVLAVLCPTCKGRGTVMVLAELPPQGLVPRGGANQKPPAELPAELAAALSAACGPGVRAELAAKQELSDAEIEAKIASPIASTAKPTSAGAEAKRR